jgi:hypothetical protein
MKTQIKVITLWVLFLALALIVGVYLSDTMKVADAADNAEGPAACLACHGGSFDKLASKKAAFKAPSGEIINPHQYVPHNEKKAENVPNCIDCHSAHPIPPKEKIDLSKVTVDSCFSCHHEKNFNRCNTCHNK